MSGLLETLAWLGVSAALVVGAVMLFYGSHVRLRRIPAGVPAPESEPGGVAGVEVLAPAPARSAVAPSLAPELFAGWVRRAVLAYYGCIGVVIAMLLGVKP